MTIVMVTAPWCGACVTLYPVLQKIAADRNLPLEIVDIEDQPQVAAGMNISSLPTTVLEHFGSEVNRVVGSFPEQRFQQLLFPTALEVSTVP